LGWDDELSPLCEVENVACDYHVECGVILKLHFQCPKIFLGFHVVARYSGSLFHITIQFFAKWHAFYMLLTWHKNNNFSNLWLDIDCQLEKKNIYKK